MTPQFHVVFDDKFKTAVLLPKGTTLCDKWLDLLNFSHDNFGDNDHNDDIGTSLLPCKFSDWLHSTTTTPLVHPAPTPRLPQPSIVEHDNHIKLIHQPSVVGDCAGPVTNIEENTISEGVNNIPEGAIVLRKNSPRQVGTWKDGPAKLRKLPIDDEAFNFSFTSSSDPPVAMVANRGFAKNHSLPQKLS